MSGTIVVGVDGSGTAKKAAESARDLAAAILFDQGAEAVVVRGLFHPAGNKPKGGVAPAAIQGVAGTHAGAGVQGLHTGVEAHVRRQGPPVGTGMAQALGAAGGRRRAGFGLARLGGDHRRRVRQFGGDIDRRLENRRGRQGDQRPGLVDADIQRICRQAVAARTVRQRLHADELAADIAAQFAGGAQFGRIGDIDGPSAQGGRRRLRVRIAPPGEDQGDHHGRKHCDAGADGDQNAIVSGHEGLARLESPITPPGHAASTLNAARSRGWFSRQAAPVRPDSWPADWSDRPGPGHWPPPMRP